ncbi:hypothetical protein [Mycobacteroides abscessus]|uniref:hypothetical protein n=1 Tax=Mycobacteroides abscessus TaxID=36809 RepID=UPI00232FAB05|nr:hypothetical protein [Mycobacteroides abscessus]MDB2196210.1 hypothetical protein [Mycobacteroides abscessus subsp. abscessus]MDB2199804.1 hypothetical protein [Mycobacteroides abscessus subsp. abscessus]
MTDELRPGFWVIIPSGRKGVLTEQNAQGAWYVKVSGGRGIGLYREDELKRY